MAHGRIIFIQRSAANQVVKSCNFLNVYNLSGCAQGVPGEKLNIPLEKGLTKGKGAQASCFSLKQNNFSSAQHEGENDSERLTFNAGGCVCHHGSIPGRQHGGQKSIMMLHGRLDLLKLRTWRH